MLGRFSLPRQKWKHPFGPSEAGCESPGCPAYGTTALKRYVRWSLGTQATVKSDRAFLLWTILQTVGNHRIGSPTQPGLT